MALYHRATITPTKAEMIERWLPAQPWGPGDAAVEVVGAYRFDDPEHRAGLETFLVAAAGRLYHVPLTYRDEPFAGAGAALMGEMEHSALGTRWVYDGLGDDRYVTMLAAVALTGQGEALGMVENDGRWLIAPTNIRLMGGGRVLERVAVDGFERTSDSGDDVVFANDRYDLTFHRCPVAGPQPAFGLRATWDGGGEPVVLSEISER